MASNNNDMSMPPLSSSSRDDDMPLQAVGGGTPSAAPPPTAPPIPAMQGDRTAAVTAMSHLDAYQHHTQQSNRSFGYGGYGGGVGGFFGSLGRRLAIRFAIGGLIVLVTSVAKCINSHNHPPTPPQPPAVQQPNSTP